MEDVHRKKFPFWATLVALVVFMGSFALDQYALGATRKNIAEYYKVIENQEKISDDVLVTEADLKEIDRCQKAASENANQTEECVRTFYDQYTMEHGVEKAFAHLARLQKEHPNLLPSCHYISHGIGHAALRLNGKDPYKTFTAMQSEGLYRNIVTCGNGYFHGVIEEVAKNITDKDELVKVLRSVCNSDKISNNAGNCFHGIGHAAMIKTDYSVDDMLYVCDRVSARRQDIFGCDTGGFMEYAQIFGDAVRVHDKKMVFTLCDSLETKYQPACYLEHSSFFEAYAKDRRDYTENIGYCRQIENDLNRMSCVKLFAIRAVRLAHFKDIYDMCLNTSSRYERVMCTAVIADRVGGSMDSSRTSGDYRSAVRVVCGTLNPLYENYCDDLVFKHREHLFYTSASDLQLYTGWPLFSIVK